ncbi:MAG: LptF/LptG family permease [bacterium]
MLLWFFLSRFYALFFVLFVFVTILLACSNFFVRLPFVPTLETFPVIFWTMLPMMALFAIPLAASLAVQIPLGSLMVQHETLFFYCVTAARRAIYAAAWIFSLSILLLYTPLVFEWSPKSYSEGKRQLIKLAKKQFSRFAPQVFNVPFPDCTVFFKEKVQPTPEVSLYKSLLLAFKNKKKGHYIFTANKAYLYNDTLVLQQGSVYLSSQASQPAHLMGYTAGPIQTKKAYVHEHNDHYQATFDRAEIELNRLFSDDNKGPEEKKLKFLKWDELIVGMERSSTIFTEFHKRIAQIFWLVLLPILALLSIFVFGREGKSNLVASLVLSGLFFILIYLCTSVGQIFHTNIIVALFFFYLPPVVIFLILFYLYKNRL